MFTPFQGQPLPPNPTREQVRALLEGRAIFVPKPQPQPAHRNMAAYLQLSEAWGRPLHARSLREAFAKLDWRHTFLQLASLGAALANAPTEANGVVERMVTRPLRSMNGSLRPAYAAIGNLLERHPDRPVVHEQVIYFLQAVALLEGNESGRTARDSALAFLILAANDHLSQWAQPDAGINTVEKVLADLCHVARFNRHPDPLNSIVRSSLVFERRPPHGKLSDQGAWDTLQADAFGCSFREFFETRIVPLMFVSQAWGTTNAAGKLVLPILLPDELFKATKVDPGVGVPFVRTLSVSRDDARAELRKRVTAEGLPHAPALFVRKPFVDMGDGALVAASPWVVWEQIKGGLWARFLAASKAGIGAETWLSSFGLMFEMACRELAIESSRAEHYAGHVVPSAFPGAVDEVEDVVVADGAEVALFSAKARLIAEPVARGAWSRRELVDWYEKFLFAPAEGAYRAGAVRLLDAKVRAAKAGAVLAVPAPKRIYPVLLTFDNFCENPALYQWIDHRCKTLGLLQEEGVAPLTLATIDDFEGLMGIASRGTSVISVLRRKSEPSWRLARVDTLLRDISPSGEALRLGSMERRFGEVSDSCKQRLFG